MHHSNLGDQKGVSYGHRSENVSSTSVLKEIERNHGIVLVQELITWGDVEHSDCFTLFGLKKDWENTSTNHIKNPQNTLAGEATRSRDVYSRYIIQ